MESGGVGWGGEKRRGEEGRGREETGREKREGSGGEGRGGRERKKVHGMAELICVISCFCRHLVLEKCREFPNWQKTLKRYVSCLPQPNSTWLKPRCERKGGRRREKEMEEEEYVS